MAKREARQKPARGGAKKIKKSVAHGICHVHATFNNTIITIADQAGDTIAWASAGTVGFKGSRKSTPFASQLAAETAARKAMDGGLRSLDIIVRGPGSGREAAIRALQAVGVEIRTIRDMTPIPHNGCRPPKRRRV
jgi:small subunit ribosomal protein S11